MGACLILVFLGLAVGAGTGDAFGAFAGAFVGLHLGLLVAGVRWMRAHLVEHPATVEAHAVMCFPYAQPAECELVGDLKSRRWTDVQRCSLQPDPTRVGCDKGCIRLMNATHVRPGAAA